MTLQPHLACEKRDIFTGHQKRRAQETYSDFNVMLRNTSSQQGICHFWCWEDFWACRANRTCVSSCWHNCHVPAGFPILCNPISWAVGVNDPYALFRQNNCTGTDVGCTSSSHPSDSCGRLSLQTQRGGDAQQVSEQQKAVWLEENTLPSKIKNCCVFTVRDSAQYNPALHSPQRREEWLVSVWSPLWIS